MTLIEVSFRACAADAVNFSILGLIHRSYRSSYGSEKNLESRGRGKKKVREREDGNRGRERMGERMGEREREDGREGERGWERE